MKVEGIRGRIGRWNGKKSHRKQQLWKKLTVKAQLAKENFGVL